MNYFYGKQGNHPQITQIAQIKNLRNLRNLWINLVWFIQVR